MNVFEMIEVQQKGRENTAPWMVGEQLKDICRKDTHCAAIVAEDLCNPDMGLEACEKKIKEYADKNRGNNKSFCVPPNVAEKIIREFYGLPDAVDSQTPGKAEQPTPGILDLEDFLL